MTDAAGLGDRLTGARIVASDPDGTVTATVDGTGAVVDLAFDPRLMRLGSAAAAARVLDTVRRAQEDARRQLPDAIAAAPSSADAGALREQLTALQHTAQQQLTDMSATLTDLMSRLEGRR